MRNFITLLPVICVLILAYMESFAYGANLGETCTGDSDCTIANAHCSSSTNKCECEASYYKTSPTECSPMIAHGDKCEVDIACVGEHAKCRDKTCDCLDSYYYKTTSCVKRVDLGEACTDDTDCTTNAHCSSSTNECECEASYYQATPTECSPMIAHGDKCEVDIACVGEHAKCRDKTCDCLDSYYYKTTSCVKMMAHGDKCEVDIACVGEHAKCRNKTCDCLDSYYYKTTSCVERIGINQPCEVADKGCIQNAVCNSTTTKCDCLESFLYDSKTQSCLKSGAAMITFEFFVAMLAMAVFVGINNELFV